MPAKSKRPTIKEVAAIAGVSTQTVSRVVNERTDVADATRRRVKRAIHDLGYQPSALARSLIRQRSYTLGVVVAGLKFVGPSQTLNGIAVAAEEAGYSLLLKELPQVQTNDVAFIIDDLTARHVDGIIWAVPEIGPNRSWVMERAADLSIPVIYLTMEPREGIPVVSIDNYLGGRMAVRHLLEQGYRQIGHIAGPLDWWEARQRLAAWKETLQEAGCTVDERCWTEGNWSSASGIVAATKLFAQYPTLDALFVANDQMALGVMRVARQQGVCIPGELGLVGFDDLPEADLFWPPLTSIQQDLHTVGRTAVQEILRMIEAQRNNDPIDSRTIVLSPTLVVRESSLRNMEV